MFRKAFVAGALLALTSCWVEKGQANKSICLTPPIRTDGEDHKACAHRWAYKLAHVKEPVATVVDAVVVACEEPISTLSADMFIANPQSENRDNIERWTRKEALFRVVQARAGNCAIPG